MGYDSGMNGNTKHGNDCTMAFGRYSPEGKCARCDELRAGASPRSGWRSNMRRQNTRSMLETIKAHDCAKSGCGPVCTAFDY